MPTKGLWFAVVTLPHAPTCFKVASIGADTRVTPEDRRQAVAQRAAEIAERRAVFDDNNNN